MWGFVAGATWRRAVFRFSSTAPRVFHPDVPVPVDVDRLALSGPGSGATLDVAVPFRLHVEAMDLAVETLALGVESGHEESGLDGRLRDLATLGRSLVTRLLLAPGHHCDHREHRDHYLQLSAHGSLTFPPPYWWSWLVVGV